MGAILSRVHGQMYNLYLKTWSIFDPRYQYEPLPGPRHIRLLTLRPGADNDPISVNIQIHDLDTIGDFETVSYVWGSPLFPRRISCDGASLYITRNLHDALVRFRRPDAPIILWADAVCINQQDLAERAAQVQIMHLIFGAAVRVLVWLGKADEHTKLAAQLIRQIGQQAAERKGLAVEDLDRHLRDNVWDPRQMTELGFNNLPPQTSWLWPSMFAFFGRPYFERIWVVQEIFFSRDYLFYCGSETLTYALILHAARWIISNVQYINSMSYPRHLEKHFDRNNASNFTSMPHNRPYYDGKLFDLLQASKDFKSTDARDKIYALLNLPAVRQHLPDLVPSYEKPVLEVYSDFVVRLIRNTGNVNILLQVEKDAVGENPSWIPRFDWLNPKKSSATIYYQNYSAGTTPIAPLQPVRHNGDHILCLEGVEFDTIVDTCDIKKIRNDRWLQENGRWRQLNRRWYQQNEKFIFIPTMPWEPYQVPSNGPYFCAKDVATAYFMTLTCGCTEIDDCEGIHVEPGLEHLQAVRFTTWLQRIRDNALAAMGNNAFGSRLPIGALYEPPGLYSPEKPNMEMDTITPEVVETHADTYHRNVVTFTWNSRLFRTKRGYLGLGPDHLQAGDKVCVLFGGSVPFLLRSFPGGGYKLVGGAYVHGIMNGEVMDMLDKDKVVRQVFELH